MNKKFKTEVIKDLLDYWEPLEDTQYFTRMDVIFIEQRKYTNLYHVILLDKSDKKFYKLEVEVTVQKYEEFYINGTDIEEIKDEFIELQEVRPVEKIITAYERVNGNE